MQISVNVKQGQDDENQHSLDHASCRRTSRRAGGNDDRSRVLAAAGVRLVREGVRRGGGPVHWANTFEQIRKADPYYWRYQMVGYSFEVALAKWPSCCGYYKVYARNPLYGPAWSFYQYAAQRPPVGNDQAK